jgi:ABC-2 type transport system permease protein
MSQFFSDTYHLLVRHLLVSLRLPIWIAVTLVQPVIWLGLFGQLFRRVVEIPGFGGSGNYVEFLTPGVVVMTSLFGSAWAGMGMIQDLNEGRMDRLLATPVHRGALILARVLHAMIMVGVQVVIVLALGIVLAGQFPPITFVAVLVPAALVSASFAALSNGIALVARREETLIAVINFFGLPLTFLSASFMARELMPGWIRTISAANPVQWAATAARVAMQGDLGSPFWLNCSLLAAFALVCGLLATRAFGAYRRAT